ncbi:winged helix-turn-helix transcriptional regulator [Candidatus Poribacteria bacterium]|nr:winged helix-turn-helix transcriptional regulator [Candidatus Poribacteria bacterium]
MGEVFKALGDPTRRRIVEMLKERDLTPTEILQQLNVSQPTLSHHLDILKRAGLIEGEREGKFIRYSLNMTVLEMSIEYLMKLIGGEENEDERSIA